MTMNREYLEMARSGDHMHADQLSCERALIIEDSWRNATHRLTHNHRMKKHSVLTGGLFSCAAEVAGRGHVNFMPVVRMFIAGIALPEQLSHFTVKPVTTDLSRAAKSRTGAVQTGLSCRIIYWLALMAMSWSFAASAIVKPQRGVADPFQTAEAGMLDERRERRGADALVGSAEHSVHNRLPPFAPMAGFNLPDYEIQALSDLYIATSGTNWRWRNTTLFGPEWSFERDPQPCAPRWQGVICNDTADDDGYLHVTGLVLDLYRLDGTLPPSLFNLTQLLILDLRHNRIYGRLPASVGQLNRVTTIDLGVNLLSGTVPLELANCSHLRRLWLVRNFLTGFMPAALSSMLQLEIVELDGNFFNGTLPSWLGDLRRLQVLTLNRNNFTGPIPASLGNLANCSALELSVNHLTGPIPSALVGLSRIEDLELSVNSLSGEIPSVIGELVDLRILLLDWNHFSGLIPASLAQLLLLGELNLAHNALSGTIPSSLGNLGALTKLLLSNNQLHGLIPDSFPALSALDSWDLSANFLSGSIPESVDSMRNLTYVKLDTNLLTGTVPASLGNLGNVTILSLSVNKLHGTIPPELGLMERLEDLYLQANSLTGTLPPELFRVVNLTTFFAQYNKLRGSLEGLFNADQLQHLSLLELGHNRLTGTVPSALFALPNLLTLVLMVNCFSGVDLERACDAQALSTLNLDGLHAAPACQNPILPPGISNAYVLTSRSLGTVPACLFSMPKLNTLHLSSNRLTGSLPEDLAIATTLFDLSLSHNKLSGIIPEVIQTKYWYNLDLSYNKFGGKLRDTFGADANISNFEKTAILQRRNGSHLLDSIPTSALLLRNNRLSDRIPASVKNMLNISVLSGNLFTCNDHASDLPTHDHGRASYRCGSRTFDRPYYMWIALVATLALALAFFWRWLHTVPTTVRGAYYASLLCRVQSWYSFTSWYTSPDPSLSLSNFKHVISTFEAVCRAACWVTLAILVVMLPVYGAARAHYGTHSHEYAWSVSAAFLSGYPALGLLLAAFVVFLALATIVFRWQLHVTEQRQLVREVDPKTPAFDKVQLLSSPSFQVAGLYALYFAINFAVSVGANIGYVTAVLRADSRYLTAAQIGLSVFKVCWNSIGAVRLARWTWQQVVAIRGAYARQDSSFFALQLFAGLFDCIAIPCLVVGVISPDCYNALFVGERLVTSTYLFESCSVYGRKSCRIYTGHADKTSFVPPFTYSYQCSSSLITYYAASFVYMALIVTFVNPVVNVLLYRVYNCKASLPSSVTSWIELMFPPVLRDVSDDTVAYDLYNPYFDARQQFVELTTHFGVLLTFGLVFPPLAAAMLVAIAATVAVMKVRIGRFLTAAVDAGQPFYLQVVDSECKGVASPRMLRTCAVQLLCFTCFFYAPFLFDTLGDAVGNKRAAWVVVVVPLLPALVLACSAHFDKIIDQGSKTELAVRVVRRAEGKARASEVEMRGSVIDLEDSKPASERDKPGHIGFPYHEETDTHNALHPAPANSVR